VYEKLIGSKMNDLDLCLEVVSRSRKPLRYIWCWTYRKPLDHRSKMLGNVGRCLRLYANF